MVQEVEGKKVELYGPWQTRPWAPPAAADGVVPRNDRGNVEAPPFAAALPAGTVHIDLRSAAAAAAQLEVDAAPALVGFEAGRQGGMVPKIRGVVVCAEHADAVLEVAQAAENARLEKLRQKRCVPSSPFQLGPGLAAVHAQHCQSAGSQCARRACLAGLHGRARQLPRTRCSRAPHTASAAVQTRVHDAGALSGVLPDVHIMTALVSTRAVPLTACMMWQ